MAQATRVVPPRGRPARARNARGEGERLRTELVDAATRLMARAGSNEGLTLRAVAREAGVSAQSVYLHFEGLDDLVLAVLAHCHASMGQAMDAAAARARTPVGRVLARGRTYIEWGSAHPGLYQVMYEGRTQAQPSGVPQTAARAVFRAVRDDVAAAMAAGDARRGDADRVAVQLWAVVHGLVSLRANKPHFPWPDVVALADDAGRRLLGADPHGRPRP